MRQKEGIKLRNSFFVKFLVILAVLFAGCSTKKDETLPSIAPPPVATPSVGTISGTVHIG